MPHLRNTLLALFFICAALQADDNDTGTSHNLIVKYKLDDHWYLGSRSNVATKEGLSEYAITYADLTVGYQFDKNWSLDAGYRHAKIRLPTRWRDEFRPLINLSWKTMKEGWFISNRARVEFRTFEHARSQDRLRFRNEIRLVSPWEMPGIGGRIFAEEEFFWETTDVHFNMNWLTAGLRWKLDEGVFVKGGYRWQESKFGGKWETRHVAVSGLVLFF